MSLSNEEIIEAIASKSLMEIMDLVKAMEEKFGVSAAAPVAVAAAPISIISSRSASTSLSPVARAKTRSPSAGVWVGQIARA